MTLEYAVIILAITAVIGSYIQYKLGYSNGYEDGYATGIREKLQDIKIIKFLKKGDEEK